MSSQLHCPRQGWSAGKQKAGLIKTILVSESTLAIILCFLSCESAPASQRTALPPSSTNTIIFLKKKALQCDVLTGWLTAGGDNLQDNGMIWRRQSEASNLVIRAISQYFLFDRPVFHLLTHLEESYWSAHRLRAHSAPQLWQIQEMRHRHAEYHLKRGSLTFLVLVLKMEPECLLCCVWPDH